jgi:hypothetical protein
MPQIPSNSSNDLKSANDKMHSWFEQTIVTLISDRFQMETEIASPEKRKMYDTLIHGQEADIHSMGRNSSTVFFIRGILKEYIQELTERKIKLNKLAFDLTASKVLVWAEVYDDDEEAIDSLILAEAKINANYSQYGFYISTTTVEVSDQLPIPSQYKEVNLKSPVGII